MKKKNRHLDLGIVATTQLNVMPFIDIFSLLCTFLLFSAVFISIGILEVQVPFLTNAAPSKEQEDQVEKRNLTLTVELGKDKVFLNSEYTKPPIDKKRLEFVADQKGLQELHETLVTYKNASPEADTVKLSIDDDVDYQKIVRALDEIKLIEPADKIEKDPNQENVELGKRVPGLFPKVIISNVIF